MNKVNTIILIISILVFLIILLIILYKFYDDKIKELLNKTNDSSDSCFKRIKEKNEIIIKLIDIINNKFKIDSKTFDEVKNLNITNNNFYKHDKLLNKCFDEILKIKEDNPKSKSLKTLKDAINKYNENELHIISLRTYYNENTMKYNNLIKKIPYNIISKFKKYKLKLLFEGKELEKDN